MQQQSLMQLVCMQLAYASAHCPTSAKSSLCTAALHPSLTLLFAKPIFKHCSGSEVLFSLYESHSCTLGVWSIPVHVSTKSPMPARPPMVMGWAPLATANRVISTRPRVIRAALALFPKPRPSDMPQAMASTFLRAPPISTPDSVTMSS